MGFFAAGIAPVLHLPVAREIVGTQRRIRPLLARYPLDAAHLTLTYDAAGRSHLTLVVSGTGRWAREQRRDFAAAVRAFAKANIRDGDLAFVALAAPYEEPDLIPVF